MEKKSAKTKVYNVIIMDRSGSMWSIQRAAINGYNEVLGGIKAAKKQYGESQEQLLTLVLFDSSAVDTVYWNADPESAEILTTETYVPGAATPLYDAMGQTITRLQKELKKADDYMVIVTIITDGYENSSKEYSLPAIRALVETLTKDGWSFAYMGTDHDVKDVTVKLSIKNVINFEKTEEDTRRAFARERSARERGYAEMMSYRMEKPNASKSEQRQYCASILMDYYKDENNENK